MKLEPSEQSEEEVAEKWGDLSRLADELIERSNHAGGFPTMPGSAMAGDDARLDGYPITSAFHLTLMAAIDHLHALTSLVEVHRMLHVAAPGSLARGVMENAATAFWLIRPPQRNERMTRTLRWFATNAADQGRAVGQREVIGGVPAEEVLGRLREVAETRGIDPREATRRVTSTATIAHAEEHARSREGDDVRPMLAWQVCSGFAHGRPWAYLGMSNMEVNDEEEPSRTSLAEIRLTNTADRALWPALAGYHLLQATVWLHQTRSRSIAD